MEKAEHEAYLILESGKIFQGKSFGALRGTVGEIVFATGMTGYLETLTDPSYYGQAVVQTFPLIGNYGVIPDDFESGKIYMKAYIVNQLCTAPSNFRSVSALDAFLKEQGIVGLHDIDTRTLTKTLRSNGVMNGMIALDPADADMDIIGKYRVKEAVANVSTRKIYKLGAPQSRFHVAVYDLGLKTNIIRELVSRGCEVTVLPHDTKADRVLGLNPDGVMLTNGPGDPVENAGIIENLKILIAAKVPIFGICLGHQLLALAHGFKTEKLKYGHRGANQPVKNLFTKQVYISSQNHGYAVVTDSIIPGVADSWFVNVNDNTSEGIWYCNTPCFSVQFHPEACSGPRDTAFLFERFIELMEVNQYAAG
ncbi:MAG: carbamoyl phosphate synthase small subunit [Syntrophomonadaceae bacterium]|nr:carbamoyl phosphate synthase small subunit [Syntrophomonadaceae bacterium]